ALLGAESLKIFTLVCAGFGAALGWLQIHHERPRDLWAFLVHRPITRTKIFFAKIIVGLLLYFLAVSLPLLGSGLDQHLRTPWRTIRMGHGLPRGRMGAGRAALVFRGDAHQPAGSTLVCQPWDGVGGGAAGAGIGLEIAGPAAVLAIRTGHWSAHRSSGTG